MNISEIAAKAEAFRATLRQAKTPQSFEWYRYDSLANLKHIDKLLTGPNRILPANAPVLDIGCADGDLAFFLESLGFEVTAIDYPPTNHNSMAGVRKLKEILDSRIEILAMDVDSQFSLPDKPFGLAVVLGAVYHLKNPFYLLETVSRHAKQMLLSTRVAKYLPGVSGSVQNVSLAYLLTETELNSDDSNYWIFSEAGFRQMLRRTNWDVLDLKSFGNSEASNPIDPQRDERIFCFARSRYALGNVELLEGWHEPEGAGWRWTMREFGVRIQLPSGVSQAALKLRLYVTPESLARFGAIALEGVTYRESGDHELLIDAGMQDGSKREFHFQADHAIPPDANDGRERAIIVRSIEIVSG